MTSSKNDKTSLRKRNASKKAETSSDTTADGNVDPKTGKKYVLKKEMPSIQYMLAHGAPESEGKPTTWLKLIGYPLALGIVFFISLLIFHYAPHDKSRYPRGRFRLPAAKRPAIFQSTPENPEHIEEKANPSKG